MHTNVRKVERTLLVDSRMGLKNYARIFMGNVHALCTFMSLTKEWFIAPLLFSFLIFWVKGFFSGKIVCSKFCKCVSPFYITAANVSEKVADFPSHAKLPKQQKADVTIL